MRNFLCEIISKEFHDFLYVIQNCYIGSTIYLFIYFVILWFELRALCLLASSLPFEPHPQSFCFSSFSDRVLYFLPRAGLHTPLTQIGLKM
jgi:hypothetical protein